MRFDFLAALLVLGYACLFVCAVAQEVLIVRFRHSLRSFQSFLLCSCIVWLPLRMVFWIKTTVNGYWDRRITITLFEIPTAVIFTTFSLLAVFFAHIIHWKRFFVQTVQPVHRLKPRPPPPADGTCAARDTSHRVSWAT
jgi:hypothetical protein